MDTLSESAIALLKDYRGDIIVDDSNRAACRELAGSGFLVVGHSFVGGREHFYRMTEEGVEMIRVLTKTDATFPSPSRFASPRR